MPIYKRSEAKEGGWAQVRTALQKFEGDVVSAEDGKWGGQMVGADGVRIPAKEFLEIKVSDVKVLEVTEELSIDIEGQDFNWRENCSLEPTSFWVDEFLASADKYNILLPDGIVGKRLIFEKKTKLANKRKDGTPGDPKFNATNYVIAGVVKDSPKVAPKVSSTSGTATTGSVETEEDLMQIAADLAVGKTETQFRSAISLHPKFAGSPMLQIAKAGLVTASLIENGKLVEVKEDNKTVYKKP